MIRDPQDLADELEAERVYSDNNTIPIVDAFDMFDVPLACVECGHLHWTGSEYIKCPIRDCTCSTAERTFPLCIRDCGRRTSRGTGECCGDCSQAEAGVALSKLIREHPEAFVFGFQGDDMEYGSVCAFCGNRSAVCRCND